MLLVSILLIFAVIAIAKVYDYVFKFWFIYKIPGPTSWPLIGNVYTALLPLDTLFAYLRKLQKVYGGIYQLHACNIRTINISNPADVEIILSSNTFIEKEIPYTFLKPWLHEGLLISNGNKWHHRRKLLTRAFHFSILKKYFNAFTEQAQNFLVKVQTEAEKDKTNIVSLATNATLNVMFETAMGTSTYKTKKTTNYDTTGCYKYFKGIETIGQTIIQRFTRPWLYADTLFRHSKIGITQKSAIKDVRDFTMKIILDRKTYLEKNTTKINLKGDNDEIYGQNGRLAMLDLLLENEREGTISIEGVREEVDTFMFEGHDTTAMALSFMIMRIANESAIQNMIYEEMNSIFGQSGRSATMEDLNKMKYLDCCIKESLRIYPSVPFIARYITKEVELSGYRIPPGTTCNIHIYDMHHNNLIFPDPEKFKPERFLSENSTMRPPYSYIPFSAGPRNCIGQKFAILEIKTIMSSLLRRFRLEPVTKPEDITFTCDLVLRAKHPIFVKFCPRELEKANKTSTFLTYNESISANQLPNKV